ncbi:MAG TPA: hypothetical protein PK156_44900 [Polyangium sp.]|nr:hypothetical protein [Polyangium sp.]
MSRFRYLTLADLKLGLDDLLNRRQSALRTSSFGQNYEPLLVTKQTAVNALPAALTGGKPLAEALAETDDQHDRFGSAIWHITEAYLQLPVPNATTVAAISRVRAALIPSKSSLQDSYADEAEAAARRQENLATLERDLRSIPVSMGGSTLFDWAEGFLEAGQKLATLLSDRADASTSGRAGAQKLRSETIALLNRARRTIADEMANASGLPADLDQQIWGYFDELEAHRADAVARGRKDPAPTPPTP